MNTIPVIAGHQDTLLNLQMGSGRDFFQRGTWGHIDLPRAREGNLAGSFFAVFVTLQIRVKCSDLCIVIV